MLVKSYSVMWWSWVDVNVMDSNEISPGAKLHLNFQQTDEVASLIRGEWAKAGKFHIFKKMRMDCIINYILKRKRRTNFYPTRAWNEINFMLFYVHSSTMLFQLSLKLSSEGFMVEKSFDWLTELNLNYRVFSIRTFFITAHRSFVRCHDAIGFIRISNLMLFFGSNANSHEDDDDGDEGVSLILSTLANILNTHSLCTFIEK